MKFSLDCTSVLCQHFLHFKSGFNSFPFPVNDKTLLAISISNDSNTPIGSVESGSGLASRLASRYRSRFWLTQFMAFRPATWRTGGRIRWKIDDSRYDIVRFDLCLHF